MARLYGEKEDINTDSVKDFFDRRASKEVDNLMVITSFQEKENLNKRQEEESKVLLDKISLQGKKVIEIGCGLGRWAAFFHDKCDEYLGIDYSRNLIKIAKENYNYANCHFQEMSAFDIDIEKLIVNPPFDIIFIAGVLIYLNDADIPLMIKEINKISSKNKVIYVRETISKLDTRLTLKDFYSDDLKVDYNAIYRTENELLSFFKQFKDISNIESNPIHETLNKHEETGYKYFILR
jgi:ubiquinone/menaquinone biosynthesis C-methylase UbiE